MPRLARRVALVLALVAAASLAAQGSWERIEALEEAGDLEAALTALEATASGLDGDEALRAAETRHRLLHRARRLPEAQAAGERWAGLARAAGDRRHLARALRQTGRSLAAQLDRDDEAERMLERALDVAAEIGDDTLEAEIAIDRAVVLSRLGRYLEADRLLSAAAESATGEDRLTARRLTAWGTLLQNVGDRIGARQRRQEAVEAASRLGDARLLSIARVNLAQTLQSLHDYAGALELLARELESEHERSPTLRIITLMTVGICHFELNQLEAAAGAFTSALELATELGNLSLRGWAEGELGLVAWQRRDDSTAMELFDRAIASCRDAGDVRNEAVWWTNKGNVRRDQERWEEALALYRQAEELHRSLPGQRPPAGLPKEIGQCLAGLGRHEEAAERFREALTLARESGNTKAEWQAWRELARLHRRAGRGEEAGAAYLAALEGVESIRGGLQLESFETDFFTDKVEVYVETIEALLAAGGPEAAARSFEIAERARARAFLGSLAESRAGLAQTLPEELVRRERELLLEISQLEAAKRRQGSTPEIAAELASREEALRNLELSARVARPRFAELRRLEPLGVAQVAAALVPGELLAAYLLADGGSHLWLLDSTGLVRHFPLPSRGDLEPAIRRLYTQLLDPGSDPEPGDLAETLLGPLAALDAPPATVVFVPWGILHYLPLEVLPVAGERLADRAATSYVPSASALVELRRRPVAPAAARCLAVGDTAGGDGDGQRRGLADGRAFGPLPQARVEVASLRSRFGRGAATALVGDAATESRFKGEELDRYSVLHLATHGWIDASSPARSGLLLGPGGDEDGVLRFPEILRLDLAADLVTLSACQSALGELVTGEGVVGLARAFFYAGSDTVVASLWNVSDEASATLMEQFYAALSDGASKAEALRRARLAVANDERYRHPYYWAPFVLLGRGEDGVEVPAGSARYRVVVAVALLAVLLLVLRARRRRA